MKQLPISVLGFVLAACLMACSKSPPGSPAPGGRNPNQAVPPAENQLVNSPPPATVTPPPPALTATLRSGDQAEFQRRLMRAETGQKSVFPEDYAAGPVLNLTESELLRFGGAVGVLEKYFDALPDFEKAAPFCSPAGIRFTKTIFGPYAAELASLKPGRFLAKHHFDTNEAAFTVRLLTDKGSTRLQFYLNRPSPNAKWQISDIQGDASTLSQATETGYTDYVPQESERVLIREGHIR